MVLGIIAEYNPFHNGHLYHILKSKSISKDDYVVAIISGNFSQRGEPSLIDKWVKAEMALSCGVDLVIELPTIYSISSAENFADGAIKILNSLKIIDHLSFGAECAELNKLNIIANVLYKEPKYYKTLLANNLKKGISFPKARASAVGSYLNNPSFSNILSEPNNILAIEYLKALKKHKSNIEPILIERKNSGHLNPDYTGTFTSSSSIRNMIKNGHFSKLKDGLTPSSYTILKEEISNGNFVTDLAEFEKIILYNLRLMPAYKIKNLPDVSEGLENSIKKAAFSCNTLEEFMNIVCTKRYTKTRINRILLYSLLGITKKDMLISKRISPYIRVLGFSENGKSLLSKLNNSGLNVITSVKKFLDTNNNKNLENLINEDILATNVYTLALKGTFPGNLDLSKRIVTK